jgi:hypothetical protein
MREESHLDEMRAALRGDLERLAARRGEHVLLGATVRGGPRPAQPETAAVEGDRASPEPTRSLLARLLGR